MDLRAALRLCFTVVSFVVGLTLNVQERDFKGCFVAGR